MQCVWSAWWSHTLIVIVIYYYMYMYIIINSIHIYRSLRSIEINRRSMTSLALHTIILLNIDELELLFNMFHSWRGDWSESNLSNAEVGLLRGPFKHTIWRMTIGVTFPCIDMTFLKIVFHSCLRFRLFFCFICVRTVSYTLLRPCIYQIHIYFSMSLRGCT